MYQPEELTHDRSLTWSTGTGTDVWVLFCACVEGNLENVERLLAKDASLARCQYSYRKPLYFAVRENRIDVAEFLLQHDPDPVGLAVNDSLVEVARDRGYQQMEELLVTRLAEAHNASAEGEPAAAALRAYDLPKLRSLLDDDPQLVQRGDARGNQPIHWATMTRQLEAVDELCARGADLEAQRIDGACPIQLAGGDYHHRGWRDVPKGHRTSPREVIDHLRACGAECDICTAAHIGDLQQVAALLARDAGLANRNSNYVAYYACSGAPIRNAAAAGHIDIVSLLLERGADPNLPEEGIAPRGQALYLAAANGHMEIAKLLLEHGADPNAEVESSADTLSRVISNGDNKMLELLLTYGAARGVHLLAFDNDLQTAAAVFDANPALANDPEALANAAGGGYEAFVRLMLRYQPDLPRRVKFPAWSVGAKTHELNELLFQHGMNPSAADWLGVTPLHQFARQGDLNGARQFLDHGADLHARDDELCATPLGWAAKFGQQEMAELLLQHGARPNLPDDPPWATPLAWAQRRGHVAMAEFLRSRGST